MSSRETILDNVYQLAFRYEAERGSCPQCVLSALMETLNVGTKDIIKAGDALAGGTSLSSRGTCGALVGGMLALSSLAGRSYKDFSFGKGNRCIFRFSKRLYDKFIQEYGSPLCCDVQKKLVGRSYVLFDKEQYASFEKKGSHIDKCPSVAGNVAKWTAAIIIDEFYKR
jgi:C_GCAxxG_C_C family probable redox protein